MPDKDDQLTRAVEEVFINMVDSEIDEQLALVKEKVGELMAMSPQELVSEAIHIPDIERNGGVVQFAIETDDDNEELRLKQSLMHLRSMTNFGKMVRAEITAQASYDILINTLPTDQNDKDGMFLAGLRDMQDKITEALSMHEAILAVVLGDDELAKRFLLVWNSVKAHRREKESS